MIIDDKLKMHDLGFYQLRNKPSQKKLQQYYNKKYYQEQTGSYQNNYNNDEIKYFDLKINQKAYVIDKLINYKGRLLDVGCGEGFTLKYYFNKGWDVKGIDFSQSGIEKHNPGMGKYIDVGDIYDKINKYIDKKFNFDVIYLTNVLEHVLDPVKLLKTLKSLLSSRGVLCITVPNDGSDLQEFCLSSGRINDRFWIFNPDHISYFTLESLKNISKYTGWKFVDIIAEFPVDLFLLNDNSNYVKNKDLGKQAHYSRIAFEILLSKRNIKNVVEYYRSLARIGMGRDITAFLMK